MICISKIRLSMFFTTIGLVLVALLTASCQKTIINDDNTSNVSSPSVNDQKCGNGICDSVSEKRTCPSDCVNAVPVNKTPINKDSTVKIPLIDMRSGEYYQGEDGGLYGNYLNVPPDAHRMAALKAVSEIMPLDASGNPSSNGKIGMMSLGMSNTEGEFGAFKDVVDSDTRVNTHLVLVNTAQFGEEATKWSTTDEPWIIAKERIDAAQLTPEQMQVAWIKLAIGRPEGGFPDAAEQLKSDTETIIQRLKKEYPNIKIVYLTSRTYAGYSDKRKNPEPYAYESGYSMRWVIQDQINGKANLAYDKDEGPVYAPVIVWGPYIWADGLNPRSDGLIWEAKDFKDGVHLSDNVGMKKATDMMMDFFTTNELAKGWFLK